MRVHLDLTLVLLFASLVSGITGCTKQERGSAGEDALLDVTVSIVPQKYFVERIGGEHVNVNVMVQPGNSPATYEPRPEQIKALSEADAYVSIGVPFEKAWIERFQSANSSMMIVDTTQGIELQPITADHDHEGETENLDPHIWTSPRLVRIQARTMCDALIKLDLDSRKDYRANLDSFVADIDRLDANIKETLSALENRRFMVFHPAWGYFARDFDLEMIPVEIEGKEPSASELGNLIAEAKEEGIKVIFAQPEFSRQSAETIAREIGGEVLLISPLAPNWLENLQHVADTFVRVLDQRAASGQ